jgi:hypothetical protein
LARRFLETLVIHPRADWNTELLGLAVALQIAKNKQLMGYFFELLGLAFTLQILETITQKKFTDFIFLRTGGTGTCS